MSVIQLQKSLQTDIKAKLPGVREVEIVEGEFTQEIVAKVRKAAPAVFISAVRVQAKQSHQGSVSADVTLIFLVAAKSGHYQADRYDAKGMALRISEQLLALLMPRVTGPNKPVFSDLTRADDVRQTNAVMLGEAVIEVVIDAEETAVADLNQLLIGFEPETGPDHVDDYIEVGS